MFHRCFPMKNKPAVAPCDLVLPFARWVWPPATRPMLWSWFPTSCLRWLRKAELTCCCWETSLRIAVHCKVYPKARQLWRLAFWLSRLKKSFRNIWRCLMPFWCQMLPWTLSIACWTHSAALQWCKTGDVRSLKPGYAVTAVEENHGARGKIESNEPSFVDLDITRRYWI